MTLPTQLNSADSDVNSLLNNREFQEMLQEYFQSNTMTMDEFLEHLPRFMIENYGLRADDEDMEQDDEEIEQDDYEDDLDEEEFLSYLHRSGFRAEPRNNLDPSDVLMRSLLAGRREIREIPLRNILPQSPPPSPTPNLATNANSIPFFQRYQQRGPQVPARPTNLRRVPSQLRNSTTRSFDPNGADKSPFDSPILLVPDLNNNYETFEEDLPLTSEFMRRFGHGRIIHTSNGRNDLITEDRPER